ncbi:MAG: hypothetical protein M3N16_00595 [Actinomycetota bacterium]|nr:hypothetical protein [Actinomycetota bacterium]
MAVKGRPLSLRLSERAYAYVTEHARRTRRAKGAVVEDLVEEALRMRLFPGIGFRGGDADRRAWVVGTGLDVWEVIRMLEDFGSPERLTAETHLEPRDVSLAVAYREHHPEEVDRRVADSRRPLSELRERYPTFEVIEVDE